MVEGDATVIASARSAARSSAAAATRPPPAAAASESDALSTAAATGVGSWLHVTSCPVTSSSVTSGPLVSTDRWPLPPPCGSSDSVPTERSRLLPVAPARGGDASSRELACDNGCCGS